MIFLFAVQDNFENIRKKNDWVQRSVKIHVSVIPLTLDPLRLR